MAIKNKESRFHGGSRRVFNPLAGIPCLPPAGEALAHVDKWRMGTSFREGRSKKGPWVCPLGSRRPCPHGSITVNVLYRKALLGGVRIKDIVKKVLKEEKIARTDLNIVLAGDAFIRKLNKKFFSRSETTDVLCFDLRFPRQKSAALMADVVVSMDRAVFMARKLKLPFVEELARYIIHGILHLAGYDDTIPSEKIKMWKRQEFLLRKIIAEGRGTKNRSLSQ